MKYSLCWAFFLEPHSSRLPIWYHVLPLSNPVCANVHLTIKHFLIGYGNSSVKNVLGSLFKVPLCCYAVFMLIHVLFLP